MSGDGSGRSSSQSSAANWIADFLRPINIIFLLIGVIGVILGVISYWSSRQNAQISYYTNTIQIVDQKEPGPFTVLDSLGRPVKENIYATNVTVWNSGDLPLEPDKVRRPLQISLTGGEETHILDAKLAYTTRENSSSFTLTTIFRNIGRTWRKLGCRDPVEHFDPTEGFRLKLIYASKEQQSVLVKGVIFGISSFVNTTPPPKGQISFFPAIASLIFLTLGSLLQLSWTILARIEWRIGTITLSENKRQILRYGGILSTAFGIFLLLSTTFSSLYPPNPPF